MQNTDELWKQIHTSFEWHRKANDPNAQSALDRVAMKCLHAVERKSFNPSTCAVREEVLSATALGQLVIFHSRSVPQRIEGPIVVLRIGGRNVVIDGNTRANAWKAGAYSGPLTAIVVEPHENAV